MLGCSLPSVILLASLLPPPCAAAADAWVHGSFVNVREQASETAAVVAQLTANTPVRVLERQERWCRIEAGKASGYLICRLIGERPLSLDDSSGDDDRDAKRAFWVAPSVFHFIHAGFALERTLLDAERSQAALQKKQLLRYPVPEYEAMKRLLANGIRVSQHKGMSLRSLELINESDRRLPDVLRQWPLPPVRVSVFRKEGDVVPQYAEADPLAALGGGRLRAAVMSGPKIIDTLDGPVADGFWDVGELGVTFDAPVFLHRVSAAGEISAGRVTEAVVSYLPDQCSATTPYVDGLNIATPLEDALPGYPTFDEEKALTGFYVAKPLPERKAKVVTKTRRLRLQLDGDDIASVRRREIDLDSDGVVDLLTLDAPLPLADGAEEPYGNWNATFFNAGGRWYLGYHQEDTYCD